MQTPRMRNHTRRMGHSIAIHPAVVGSCFSVAFEEKCNIVDLFAFEIGIRTPSLGCM